MQIWKHECVQKLAWSIYSDYTHVVLYMFWYKHNKCTLYINVCKHTHTFTFLHLYCTYMAKSCWIKNGWMWMKNIKFISMCNDWYCTIIAIIAIIVIIIIAVVICVRISTSTLAIPQWVWVCTRTHRKGSRFCTRYYSLAAMREIHKPNIELHLWIVGAVFTWR